MRVFLSILLVLCSVLAAGNAVFGDNAAGSGASPFKCLPEECSLSGTRATQRLLVERVEDGGYVGEVVEGISWSVEDPSIVDVKEGLLFPKRNGETTVTARVGDSDCRTRVRVSGMEDEWHWSFRNHVQSVLTRASCNSGACHGAIAGKNGFSLSLRGYHADGDYQKLTRDARGRRVAPEDPARSLMLLKPTGALPHKGGVRFETDSLEYQVLSEWIATGALPPRDDDPVMESLEVLPGSVTLAPGMKQRLVVRARFSDGHEEDVTGWAKFTSTDGAVAEVDEQGVISVLGHGEVAVTVWYLSHIVVATITVPFKDEVPAEVYSGAPRRGFIDEMTLAKLASLRLPPSPRSSDEEFLRRAYLDTIGVLPTVAEVRRFIADGSSTKRDRLIDELLERPEYVDYWAYKWSDVFLVNSRRISRSAVWAYYRWIRQRVAANLPWNEMVQQVLRATGSTLENGAANFFLLHNDPFKMAENSSVAFLGLSINCARCHNHPMEKWTNDQYFGMVSLFARVRSKMLDGDNDNRLVFDADDGEVDQPLHGRPQAPRPLDGEALPFGPEVDRRLHLARWMTSPENPYFSRAIANRVWANFMGVGLVEAVDDLRKTNPASNEELLTALANFLTEKKYDLKALMREILRSETYQRSSEALPGNKSDRRFYSRYYPRRLMAEVLLDCLSDVTDAPTQFKGYPQGWRAIQLPDSNVGSYFLQSFGRPDRLITCSCERSAEPSMSQVLHLANGDAVNQKLAAKGNRIAAVVKETLADGAVVEDLYLRALSRYPTATEKSRLLEVVSKSDPAEKRQVFEDLYWSVLTSNEFLFNH